MTGAAYHTRSIQDWTVRFEPVAWDGLETRLATVLDAKLQEIAGVLPARPLAELRAAVPIFADCTRPGLPFVAVYHWRGAEPWLRQHHEAACKAGSVNIFQAEQFILLVEDPRRYPAALLHELAHAYHDRFVPDGVANRVIADAYAQAVASGLYEMVLNVTGVMHPANAIKNAMEYFANTTTAYFLRNDDWPDDREELARRDPVGCEMVRRLWGA